MRTHPPMFALAGWVFFEVGLCTDTFAQVIVLISWVVQGDRMLLQFHSLLYLPIALCIKKHVVYLSIFENCLTLMWKILSL